ncbi:MAG: DUF2520 domain-containing protein [Chloroflexi bacterium]|nr:DUF2520 domain-containing protein [Chloroflexota bacterium]MBM4454104.1 DUF2520 domain-containing protein [Chloroflexota bacterium]
MKKQDITVGFIGAGTTGTALAVRLAQKGYRVIAVASRTQLSAETLAKRINGCKVSKSAQEVADAAQIVFITTPDDAIAKVAAEVNWHEKQNIVHCSGAHSVDCLKPVTRYRALAGCLHPLQTFASVEQAINNIPGSTFALEAPEPLLTTLKNMATALEGDWVVLKAGDKVLYHAAAVFACNYLVTLVKLATDLWQTFDVPPAKATKALMPLLRGTLNNIENVGLPNCLTGPIARGDLGTIARHLAALEKDNLALLNMYQELGLQTIPVALAKGKIDSQRAVELQALLNKKPAIGGPL